MHSKVAHDQHDQLGHDEQPDQPDHDDRQVPNGQKEKQVRQAFDFTTALSVAECTERLQRSYVMPSKGLGPALASARQIATVEASGSFEIERRFAGGLYPIRLVGNLDRNPDGSGAWVHGALTHDAHNQVLIEGMIVFLTFFLMTALLFLRLKTRAFIVSGPILLMWLALASVRWRMLRRYAEDFPRWLRQRLYLTADQIRPQRPRTSSWREM